MEFEIKKTGVLCNNCFGDGDAEMVYLIRENKLQCPKCHSTESPRQWDPVTCSNMFDALRTAFLDYLATQ